ncbi:MAG: hypothetical protein D6776_12110 [Planctomycetota bacterium]|nr:MAG: hypothetical protein D6776_12110 [Planctomycetota bacterium]
MLFGANIHGGKPVRIEGGTEWFGSGLRLGTGACRFADPIWTLSVLDDALTRVLLASVACLRRVLRRAPRCDELVSWLRGDLPTVEPADYARLFAAVRPAAVSAMVARAQGGALLEEGPDGGLRLTPAAEAVLAGVAEGLEWMSACLAVTDEA